MPIAPQPCAREISVALDCETDSVTVCESVTELATVTTVNASTLPVNLVVANPSRRGAAIYNNSSSDLFIKLGAGVSSTSFTFKAGTNGYFEVPFNYAGLITGVWTTAVGNAQVTEVIN